MTNAIDRHMLEVNTTQIVVFNVQRFLKYLHKLLRLGILPHSTLQLFCVENRENFLLSSDRNMVFPQILSHMPLLSNQWLPRYINYPLRHQSRLHFGGWPAGKWGQPPKNKFSTSFRPFSGIYELHFFRFPKKFFSPDPIAKDALL